MEEEIVNKEIVRENVRNIALRIILPFILFFVLGCLLLPIGLLNGTTTVQSLINDEIVMIIIITWLLYHFIVYIKYELVVYTDRIVIKKLFKTFNVKFSEISKCWVKPVKRTRFYMIEIRIKKQKLSFITSHQDIILDLLQRQDNSV